MNPQTTEDYDREDYVIDDDRTHIVATIETFGDSRCYANAVTPQGEFVRSGCLSGDADARKWAEERAGIRAMFVKK